MMGTCTLAPIHGLMTIPQVWVYHPTSDYRYYSYIPQDVPHYPILRERIEVLPKC